MISNHDKRGKLKAMRKAIRREIKRHKPFYTYITMPSTRLIDLRKKYEKTLVSYVGLYEAEYHLAHLNNISPYRYTNTYIYGYEPTVKQIKRPCTTPAKSAYYEYAECNQVEQSADSRNSHCARR